MSRWREYDWDLMVRRKAPIPLVAVALMLAWWLITARNGSINAVRCQADHLERQAALDTERQRALAVTPEAEHERLWAESDARQAAERRRLDDCLKADGRAN